MADIKHPRDEEILSGVKASKARLLIEAEARRKEKPQELTTKKMQAVTEEIREPEPVTGADNCKIDYRAAARDALNRVQQELVTNEIDQKVKLELENEKIQERLFAFEASEVEETKAASSLSMKLNVISGQTFGMVPQRSRIQSIIPNAGHQVIKNLSEPSEFTMMHLDTYAVYLRQVEPRTESKDPVRLDLLLRSNLVQQELSRMSINSLSLLDKTVQDNLQVMRMLMNCWREK